MLLWCIIQGMGQLDTFCHLFLGDDSWISFVPRDSGLQANLDLEWKVLCNKPWPTDIQKRFFSPHKPYETRKALIQVVTSALASGAAYDEIVLSLSHTKDATVAVAAFKTNTCSQIGIDIELSNREMSEKSAARIATDEERALGLSNLEIWTIKEAAFKAFPHNAGTTIGQYKVARSWVEFQSDPLPVRIMYQVFQVDRWTLALAKSFDIQYV